MRRQFVLSVMLLVIFVAALVGVALAGGGYSISWSVIGAGGGSSGGDSYTLDYTLGQPIAASSSWGGYEVCAGFWCGLTAAYRTYVPVMYKAY